MAIYGLYNYWMGQYLLCGLILLSALGLGIGWLMLRKTEDGRPIYRANILLFAFLLLYMLFQGGADGRLVLWAFTFPLICFYLCGGREGGLWSVTMLLVTVNLWWLPIEGVAGSDLSLGFKTRFATVYIIVCVFTYWFEHSRCLYKDELEKKNQILEKEKAQLEIAIQTRQELQKKLQKLANTDSLTGALNRRHFVKLVRREMQRHLRYNHPFAVIMLDIDFFKSINDQHGHPTGDAVLKQLVQCCHAQLRESDLLGRIGGEEFAVLLVQSNERQAVQVAERLRIELARQKVGQADGPLQFTVSLGVAGNRGTGDSLDDLLKRADVALYRAKEAGRNRVELYI